MLVRRSLHLPATVSQEIGLLFEGIQEANFVGDAAIVALPVSSIRCIHIDEHERPKICHNTPAHSGCERSQLPDSDHPDPSGYRDKDKASQTIKNHQL